MRMIAMVVLLAACGGSDGGIDAPDCDPGTLVATYTKDGRTEHIEAGGGGFAWVNKIGDDNGYFDYTSVGLHIRLEFDKLVANGDTTDARGFLSDENIGDTGLDVGNCETGGFDSKVSPQGDSLYIFELSNLHAAPYCSGASFGATISGCYQSSN